MSKGDSLSVYFPTGLMSGIKASRAGRRLSVPKFRVRQGVTYMEVEELTRGGKPTGTRLTVRVDQIASIIEAKVEEKKPPGRVERGFTGTEPSG